MIPDSDVQTLLGPALTCVLFYTLSPLGLLQSLIFYTDILLIINTLNLAIFAHTTLVLCSHTAVLEAAIIYPQPRYLMTVLHIHEFSHSKPCSGRTLAVLICHHNGQLLFGTPIYAPGIEILASWHTQMHTWDIQIRAWDAPTRAWDIKYVSRAFLIVQLLEHAMSKTY